MQKVSICVAAVLGLAVLILAGAESSERTGDDRAAISALLDDFHGAAAEADFVRYFGHFHRDGVFLGTDASERWSVADFKAYAKPHFDAGTGWSYTPTQRNIDLTADARFAWFDELLDNAKYGQARGTGALVRTDAGWRIVQYHLTFPIPNELAPELTARIRGEEAR
jgi:ketosteroid isomerase-like protein